jgi:hypothetical protein
MFGGYPVPYPDDWWPSTPRAPHWFPSVPGVREIFKGTTRPDWISLKSAWYHWKGLEKDINRCRFLIFDFWF